MSVVVKGSVTPKVISFLWSSGSGPEAISSSRWFCQKQSARATPKTTQADDRCRRAQLVEVLDEGELILVGDRPDAAGHRAALSRGRGRPASPSAPSLGARLRWPAIAPGLRRASSSSSPLTEPLNSRMPLPSERPSSGQPFGPEDDQGDDQDDRDLHGSDVSASTHGNGRQCDRIRSPRISWGGRLPGIRVSLTFCRKVRMESLVSRVR